MKQERKSLLQVCLGGMNMNIFVDCNAGMSSSIVEKKRQEAATAKSLTDTNINAFSVEVLDQRAAEADVVLLGPQIRHMKGDVEKIVAGRCPVEVINMQDYGMIRGDKVLAKALQLLGKE
jgi:PTS system cellobiose-specific IIB component